MLKGKTSRGCETFDIANRRKRTTSTPIKRNAESSVEEGCPKPSSLNWGHIREPVENVPASFVENSGAKIGGNLAIYSVSHLSPR